MEKEAEEIHTQERTNSLKGIRFLGLTGLLLGIVFAYITLVGSGLDDSGRSSSPSHLLPALIPSFLFILGSVGLLRKRKWSLYLVTLATLYLWYMSLTNGGRVSILKSKFFNMHSFINDLTTPYIPLARKILLVIPFEIIFTLCPLLVTIYLWSKYKKLK